MSDDVFGYALNVVRESGVAELITDRYQATRRGPGGRHPRGVAYTATAVLAGLLIRIILKRPPTMAGALDTIAEFTPEQLTAVGMDGQNCAAVWEARHREYARFSAWWARRLVPFDSWADLPARRMTNSVYRTLIDNRTDEQREQSLQAQRLLHVAINKLVAASVDEPQPKACRGDLVVDGSLYVVAKAASLGSADNKLRGAVACANFHIRTRKTTSGNESTTRITHAGMTVELTALTRVGSPSALHAVPPVFIGIAIHFATAGSVAGLADALEQAENNGLIARPAGPRSRWPYLTFDMAYNNQDECAELLLKHRYNPVARYPEPWGIECPSTKPPGAPKSEPEPGPLQWAGAFYCPAVLPMIKGHRTPAMRHLLENDKFRHHDKRLRRILPFLMGYNSRPFVADLGHGRPALGRTRDQAVKIKLVCPAAMGHVKCPLKPESMKSGPLGAPIAEPTWQAHERACCARSSVTVTLTPAQLKRAQWDLVPGAWEHSTYFEACRAMTEQRFSQLKSAHVTGLNGSLTYGPRREPMIKLILAMAVVASNRASQMSHNPGAHRRESVDIRMRQLAHDLGHQPAKTPPRT
ncbi:hypothetical protein [Mycolicibacterium sp.]|uniref:hypothetical protein n=1 Tax=Mycolicibacterium sp. TaxID=2320850 RepID=UPI0037CA85D2